MALAPLPLHHLVNTMTATINNTIVSMNVQETLQILLRLLDQQESAKYNGMTPTTLDFLRNYTEAVDGCPYVIDEQQNADGRKGRRPVVYTPGATERMATDASFEGARPRSFVSFPNMILDLVDHGNSRRFTVALLMQSRVFQ